MKWIKLNCPDPFETDPAKICPNKWDNLNGSNLYGPKWFHIGQFSIEWDSLGGTFKWFNLTESFDLDRDSFFQFHKFLFSSAFTSSIVT